MAKEQASLDFTRGRFRPGEITDPTYDTYIKAYEGYQKAEFYHMLKRDEEKLKRDEER